MANIIPTIGRVMWYFDGTPDPFSGKVPGHKAAIVAHVHSDSLVNLAVFDENGLGFGATSVPVVQEGQDIPQGHYCAWMPYQKGQAAKYEALAAERAS